MLGALIIHNNAIDKVAELSSGEDFYNAAHRCIPSICLTRAALFNQSRAAIAEQCIVIFNVTPQTTVNPRDFASTRIRKVPASRSASSTSKPTKLARRFLPLA